MINKGEILMEEKKYLKWYNKVGYGSGDIAGNVVYAFLTSFIMVYLTDTVGLASGIVGTLIAFSKLFDVFTQFACHKEFDVCELRYVGGIERHLVNHAYLHILRNHCSHINLGCRECTHRP